MSPYLVSSQGSGSIVGRDKGDVQELWIGAVLPEWAQDVGFEVIPAQTKVVWASHCRIGNLCKSEKMIDIQS